VSAFSGDAQPPRPQGHVFERVDADFGRHLAQATDEDLAAPGQVRQSTQSQVMTNLESQRRQYDLVDVARQRGFVDVEVIRSNQPVYGGAHLSKGRHRP
jgi:hypothetical protein